MVLCNSLMAYMKLTDKRFWMKEIYKGITGWFNLVLSQSSNHTDLPRHRQLHWLYGDVLFHQRAVGIPHSHRAMCRLLFAVRWFHRKTASRSWCRRLRRGIRLPLLDSLLFIVVRGRFYATFVRWLSNGYGIIPLMSGILANFALAEAVCRPTF